MLPTTKRTPLTVLVAILAFLLAAPVAASPSLVSDDSMTSGSGVGVCGTPQLHSTWKTIQGGPPIGGVRVVTTSQVIQELGGAARSTRP